MSKTKSQLLGAEMNILKLSRTLQVTLWLLTLVAALVWIIVPQPPFNPEPITVILGLVSTAVSALLTEFSSALKKEKYSTSYALAYGYVTNFIDPVVTQLIKTAQAEPPQLLVYIPKKVDELEPNHIDRVMKLIHEKKFSDQLLKISTGSGRTRDLISLLKGQGKPLFFDFPSTLLTLNSLIEYNLQQRNNSFTRDELATQYISEFVKALQGLIEDKGLGSYVAFTNKSLDGLAQ